jgi:putative spermidine/putrescine transport system permease protein
MIAMDRSSRATRGIRGILFIGLILSAIGPLAFLAVWSISSRWFYPAVLPTAYSIDGWHALSRSLLWPALSMSAVLASASGILGCAVALPLGRALARLRGWQRHVGAAAAFLPIAAPPLALGTGLQVLLLSVGLGGRALGVLLAHLVPVVGYLTLFFLGTFTLFDARVEAEARTLGATPWQIWQRILIPMLWGPIAEAVALGFLISWGQFALTLVVGGGAVRALPLEVFALVRAGQDQAAAVGALLLVLPPMVGLAGFRRIVQHTGATV